MQYARARERRDGDTDGHGKATDWKAVFAAAGFFYVSLTGVGWLFGEYLIGRVREHIEEHAIKVTGERARIFAEFERRADVVVGRVGDLERNCDVMRGWKDGAQSRLDGLDVWRNECGKKMAGVEQYMVRDASDIRDLEQDVKTLQDLVRKGRRE